MKEYGPLLGRGRKIDRRTAEGDAELDGAPLDAIKGRHRKPLQPAGFFG